MSKETERVNGKLFYAYCSEDCLVLREVKFMDSATGKITEEKPPYSYGIWDTIIADPKLINIYLCNPSNADSVPETKPEAPQ